MNIEVKSSPNRSPGKNRMEVIIIHHWDDPAKRPSMNGVVSWLTNPASQVSAHYVVSDKKIIQLVSEEEIAWHAREANSFSIGIEVDPNVPGDTYKTVASLVRDIRSRRGNIPLKRHRDYVSTSCPGNIDVERIDRESKSVQTKEDEMKATWDYVRKVYQELLGRLPKDNEKGAQAYVGKDAGWVFLNVYESGEAAKFRNARAAWKRAHDNPPTSRPANVKKLTKGIYEVE